MLKISNNYGAVDEELDLAKEPNKDNYRLWIVGPVQEIKFMGDRFCWPNKDNNRWFNSKYNVNAPVVNGKPFFQFPPNWVKKDGVYHWFFWQSKTPEFREAQLRSIQLFLRDINLALEQSANPNSSDSEAKVNPKLESFLIKIDQIRDYIENQITPHIDDLETREQLQGKLDKFIHELSAAVDDAELMKKINEYLVFSSIFNYSFLNTFLLFLQNRNAHEVLSIGAWRKVNMQPKSSQFLLQKYPGTGAIGLWTPSAVKGNKNAEIAAERKWRSIYRKKQPLPENPTDSDIWYKKPATTTGLGYNQINLDNFVKRTSSNDSSYTSFTMRFNFLDVEDVEQIPNTEVIDKPEKPAWHTGLPDEIADRIYEVMPSIYRDLELTFKTADDMGGSRGSSSQKGEITLLASNTGIGRASVLIHELAHSLAHQTFLTDKIAEQIEKKLTAIADYEKRGLQVPLEYRLTMIERIIRDAYVGRNATEILELQAEGTAFVVLRYFGVPEEKLKHSAAYIALWRNDKAAVEANLTIINKIAKKIIVLIQEKLDGVTNTELPHDSKELEEETLSFLYEMSIFDIRNTIKELKEIKKLLL